MSTEKDVKEERMRLWTLLAEKSKFKTEDYKSSIKHTGGLLTHSMSYAYSRGFSDAMKLILKEIQNENIQKEKAD